MRTRVMVTLLALCALVLAGLPAAQMAEAASAPSTHMPRFIRNWYGISGLPYTGSGQVIGIIGAGDYTKAAEDLAVHIAAYGQPTMYGLPGTAPCTVAAGPHPCFERVKAPPSGVAPAPLYWSGGTAYHLEAASNIQWAHVIAPGADILFVDAATPQPDDLLTAADVAVATGASVVSMSFGWDHSTADLARDEHFAGKAGVVFVAASGDRYYNGILRYPAASPHVLAVGGTTLKMDSRTAKWSETAWGRYVDTVRQTGAIGSTGGYSRLDTIPSYQAGFHAGEQRGVPDVAWAVDWIGYPIYALGQYTSVGATSLGAPLWAGLIALANQARAEAGRPALAGVSPFYAAAEPSVYAANYKDITAGYGACMNSACAATAGYDLATGLGVPRADALVRFLAGRDF